MMAVSAAQGDAHGPVLLVDDDEDILDGLSELLKLSGFEVVTARNGAEALAHARARRPCMVLLDLMMPIMSGQEFRKRQTADPGIASIPVIVVTAARPSRGELDRLAAEDCFLKPVDTERLLSAVRRLC
jgi:CheY-like chemotaxis protein